MTHWIEEYAKDFIDKDRFIKLHHEYAESQKEIDYDTSKGFVFDDRQTYRWVKFESLNTKIDFTYSIIDFTNAYIYMNGGGFCSVLVNSHNNISRLETKKDIDDFFEHHNWVKKIIQHYELRNTTVITYQDYKDIEYALLLYCKKKNITSDRFRELIHKLDNIS